jgi:hypothetical protein
MSREKLAAKPNIPERQPKNHRQAFDPLCHCLAQSSNPGTPNRRPPHIAKRKDALLDFPSDSAAAYGEEDEK